MKIVTIIAYLFSVCLLISQENGYYSDLQLALANKEKVKSLYLAYREAEKNDGLSEIYSFPNLEELRIDTERIDSITDEVRRLTKLKLIKINSSGLRYVSPELFKITSLENVSLNSNPLDNIDVKENNYTIKYLGLSYNNLKDIEFLTQFKLLESLTCRGNGLTNIPKEIFTKQLITLSLSENEIKAIPDEIRNATQLKHLFLSDNKIKKLPEGIFTLSNLEYLDLSTNRLQVFNEQFVKLVKLKDLIITYNQIEEVTGNVVFESLVSLEMWGNKLEESPKSLIRSKYKDFYFGWWK